MFVIGEISVGERIAHEQFSCDVVQCKGACCTLPGGRGAPLDDDELKELGQAFPSAKKFLSERHLQKIEQSGLYEGSPGSYATTCVDEKACAFAFFEDGIARCSFEKAFFNGETTWRKPLSCHLFPIRISKTFQESMRYEEIPECNAALVRGHEQKIQLSDFLKDALVRKYGNAWYAEFQKECAQRDSSLVTK